MVMPSCAPDSWKDSSCRACRTVPARRSPASARLSISARSTVTRPNSATTKNALPAVSSANATNGSTAVRNTPSMIGSPRTSFCRTARSRSAPARSLRDLGVVVAHMPVRYGFVPTTTPRSRGLSGLLEGAQQDGGHVDDLDVVLLALGGHAVADHGVAERAPHRDRARAGGQRLLD